MDNNGVGGPGRCSRFLEAVGGESKDCGNSQSQSHGLREGSLFQGVILITFGETKWMRPVRWGRVYDFQRRTFMANPTNGNEVADQPRDRREDSRCGAHEGTRRAAA